MPTSHYKKVGRVLSILDHIPEPKSVLEIGPGFGKFGVLLRDNLDIRKGRYDRADWAVQLDCIEIWEPYITELHHYTYNNVLIGDVAEMLGNIGFYDLIVMADVLEHMPKDVGSRILRKLYEEHTRHGIVVSYPPIIGTNWKTWVNPYEEHHCVWTPADFEGWTFFHRVHFNSSQVVYLLKE